MLLFSLCTFLLIVGIIVVLERAHLHTKHANDEQYMYVPQHPSSQYRVRTSLLGNTEVQLFQALERQISPHNHIFMKIRIADVIQTMQRTRSYTHKSPVAHKHFDFVVTNADFHPLIAIELAGKTPLDPQKQAICEEAGLPLETIQANGRFTEDIARLVSAYRLH